MKPFVKWAGGKIKLSQILIERMPKNYHTYLEPFIGGGSMLFTIKPEHAIINDVNNMLMNCYIQIRDNTYTLMELLKQLETEFNNSDNKSNFYYNKRTLYNEHKCNDILSAALFIFLNKCGFNGMHRENKKGEFNVPFGHKKSISLFSEENLIEISDYLKGIKCLSGDFEDACKIANLKEGDFVFFDSPYIETFDIYNGSGFSVENHIRLKNLYDELSAKGVYCMETNNCCETVKDLYKDYHIEDIDVFHCINRNGNDRNAKEAIITNY